MDRSRAAWRPASARARRLRRLTRLVGSETRRCSACGGGASGSRPGSRSPSRPRRSPRTRPMGWWAARARASGRTTAGCSRSTTARCSWSWTRSASSDSCRRARRRRSRSRSRGTSRSPRSRTVGSASASSTRTSRAGARAGRERAKSSAPPRRPIQRGMHVLQATAEVLAGLAQAVYLGAAFVLSAHLLTRARRRRDVAPLLLGLHLLFAMGFGYGLCAAGMGTAMLAAEPSPRLVEALLGTGYGATTFGLFAALLFQWRVFWPGARWPLLLVSAFTAAMGVGWLGAAATGALATGRYEGGFVWLLTAGALATNLWVGIEPLLYHVKLRRRVRLGLAEPIVADRFLLWGLGSLARALMVLLGPLATLALDRLGADARLLFSSLTLVAASGLGLATSVAYWLTFNPTAAYTGWVERRYRAHPS